MGLMGSMYVGTSGLQTSQNALNTTAHNMSNLDTTGYTRQQVALGTRQYNTLSKNSCATSYTQLGLGVAYSQTRQVRDYFLDKNYRRESGRSMFYETSANTLTQVEDILGESNEGKSFQITMADLWTAVEELSKDPTSKVNQNLFITRCDEFIQRAQGVYDSLATYQLDMNADVKQSVDRINEIAQRVDVLNNAIMKIETAGIEHANDLKDERNGLLDELGKYGNISWSEDEYGAVNIAFEGVDLLKNGMFNEIDIYQDPQTEFYIPFWAKNARYEYNEEGQKLVVPESIQDALIYDLYRPVSSEINTDIGGLRATLLARGDHMGSCVDISRMMILASDIAKDWGINISQVPVVGCAPEWMSEKAVSIGNYVVATGIETFLGVDPYSKGSSEVTALLQGDHGIKDWVEARFVVETDIDKLGDKMIACIEEKRAALGI